VRLALALIALAGSMLARADENEWRVPFITTPNEVVERMLEFAGTGASDLVVDLGSGDGRIVIIAAQKFGARGLGIELDQALVEKSRENAQAAKVADRVRFVQGDVLEADISKASVVTVYLLPGLITKLQPRFLSQLAPGTRIVSHAFTMTGWKPDQTRALRVSGPHPGQGDESNLYLWTVPADVRGEWRGGPWRLRIEQNFQAIEIEGAKEATLSGRDIAWRIGEASFRGRVDGRRMTGELTVSGKTSSLVLTR
jgi:protein-L-isoaspartate O-methyltransferase